MLRTKLARDSICGACAIQYGVGKRCPLKIAKRSLSNPDVICNCVGTRYVPAICNVWKVAPAALEENKRVKSNIPTLVLAAEYDAYTPPAWGRLTAQTLPRSYFFEVPEVGHGPGFNSKCARDMITAFFENPLEAPDDSCLKVARQRFK